MNSNLDRARQAKREQQQNRLRPLANITNAQRVKQLEEQVQQLELKIIGLEIDALTNDSIPCLCQRLNDKLKLQIHYLQSK